MGWILILTLATSNILKYWHERETVRDFHSLKGQSEVVFLKKQITSHQWHAWGLSEVGRRWGGNVQGFSSTRQNCPVPGPCSFSAGRRSSLQKFRKSCCKWREMVVLGFQIKPSQICALAQTTLRKMDRKVLHSTFFYEERFVQCTLRLPFDKVPSKPDM